VQERLAAERARAASIASHGQSLRAARKRLENRLANIQVQIDAANQAQDQAIAATPQQLASQPVVATEPAHRITLIQPASFCPTALPPSRSVILGGGVLLAALGGLVTAMIAAARNPIVSSARQLETLWDVPITGTIPPDLRFIPAAS